MIVRILGGLLALSLFANGLQYINHLNTKLDHSEQIREEQRKTIDVTQRLESVINNMTIQYEKDQDEADKEYANLMRELGTAKRRLRERFVCKSPTAPGAGNEEAPGGLLREDEMFLVSESKRADDIVREHNLLVEYVEKLIKEGIINGQEAPIPKNRL